MKHETLRIKELETELKNLKQFYEIEVELKLLWESAAKHIKDREKKLERELNEARKLIKNLNNLCYTKEAQEYLDRIEKGTE